ncbi:hypothetical protein ACRAWG_32335 [Methylobacterium sp. P31]
MDWARNILSVEHAGRKDGAGTKTRRSRRIGGKPLTTAHRTACKRTRKGYRIHDWRHPFAVWFLKSGGNLRALCQIAGWIAMRMVQRDAVLEPSDLDGILFRTAADDPVPPPDPELRPSDCPP